MKHLPLGSLALLGVAACVAPAHAEPPHAMGHAMPAPALRALPTPHAVTGVTSYYPVAINNRGEVLFDRSDDRGGGVSVWDNGVFTDIGTLGFATLASAIDDRGDVVGLSQVAPLDIDHGFHVFRWRDGVMTDLGPPAFRDGTSDRTAFPLINSRGDVATVLNGESGVWRDGAFTSFGVPTDVTSAPYAMNDRDQVVVEAIRNETDTTPGVEEAFVWDSGRLEKLKSFPSHLYGYSDYQDATAINMRGEVVGYCLDADAYAHAVLWDHGTLVDLEGPAPAYTTTIAKAINSRGQVVGILDQVRPVLWEHGHSVDLLDNLPDSVIQYFAMGSNDRGQVFFNYTPGPGPTIYGYHAGMWDGGRFVDLGGLGGDYTLAYAMNDKGQIVGTSETASHKEHVFLWDRGTMTDLTPQPGVAQRILAERIAPATPAPASGSLAPSGLALELVAGSAHGVAMVRFRAPTGASARIDVLDLSGRRLSTASLAGSNADQLWQWDGRDERGGRAPAGVYWVRLSAAGQAMARRLVIW